MLLLAVLLSQFPTPEIAQPVASTTTPTFAERLIGVELAPDTFTLQPSTESDRGK